MKTKVGQQISAKNLWDILKSFYSKETPIVEAPAIIGKDEGDSFKGEAISKETSSIESSDESSMDDSEDKEAIEID